MPLWRRCKLKPVEIEMREEYDIRGGVRGKYYECYRQGTNLVRLEPDVAKPEKFLSTFTVSEAKAGTGALPLPALPRTVLSQE